MHGRFCNNGLVLNLWYIFVAKVCPLGKLYHRHKLRGPSDVNLSDLCFIIQLSYVRYRADVQICRIKPESRRHISHFCSTKFYYFALRFDLSANKSRHFTFFENGNKWFFENNIICKMNQSRAEHELLSNLFVRNQKCKKVMLCFCWKIVLKSYWKW